MAAYLRNVLISVTTCALVTPANGGRYGDPTQLTTLLVPSAIAAFILIGMLGLLCFFKRRQMREKYCRCCVRRSLPETVMMQNRTGQAMDNRTSNGLTNEAFSGDEGRRGATENSKSHHRKVGQPELGHSSCPGCGSSYKAGIIPSGGENNELRSVRPSLLSRLFHIGNNRDNNDINANLHTDSMHEYGDLKCDSCAAMTHARKTLKEEDITKVGLTFDTQDVWHI